MAHPPAPDRRARAMASARPRVASGVLAVLVASATLLLGACSGADDVVVPTAHAGEVTTLDSAQGKALIQSDRRALVIDVRPVDEYRSGHLVGAQNIDASDPDAWAFRIPELDVDRPTVVYCSTASCSAAAAEDLVDAGFNEVYDMGGIEDWDPDALKVEHPETHQPIDENPSSTEP